MAALAAPAQLVAVRALVDDVVAGGSSSGVVPAVTFLVSVVVVQRLSGLMNSSLLTLARDHAAASAVSRYLKTTAHLDAGHLLDAGFHDRMRHAGEVANERFSSVIFGVAALVGSLAGLVGLGALLASISPLVGILVVASMVPWVAAQRRGFGVVRAARQELIPRRRQQAYLRGLVTDPAAGLELLASGGGDAVAERHELVSEELLRLERPAHTQQLRLITVGTVIGGVLLVGAFLVVAMAGATGQASAGDVAATVAALSTFMFVTGNMANSVSGLLEHAPYLDDYFEFLATPPLLKVPAVPSRLTAQLDCGVVFDEVTFTYPGAPAPALEAVSLRLRPGELVALVGENGAGKSTLIKLLLRLFDPEAGRVLIGGVDVAVCEPAEVRSRIAVVFQDFARYQFSVRDAVRLGAPKVLGDDERVWSALRRSGMDAFVASLPAALDTQLGPLFPGGRDISGGQWQRLALARLFYRDADILVLDEPTSSLDLDSEAATFARLRAGLGARVGLVSSHRFSTVRTADRVAVLRNGALLEFGTHEELVEAKGRYAELFERQAAAYR